MIAVERGFFAQEGVAVEVVSFPSGKRTLHDGLLGDEVDVAGVADIPFVIAALDGRPLVAVGTLSSTDDVNRVVARRDLGIERPEDLRGKRIGTQRGSAVHFFLDRFLQRHGLDAQAVKLRYLRIEDLTPALAAGEIDAFSLREPYVTTARELLGERAQVFDEPGLYRQSEVLVTTAAFTRDHPRRLPRLLRALVHAERFAARNPAAAAAITAAYLGVDRERIEAIWPTLELRVTLDQSLLSLLEREARWALDNALTEARGIPDFRALLHRQSLGAVDPARVRLNRQAEKPVRR
ncbi:NrtA/SsuA/CpmA family ABC transporter substrate-binding protein [Endothiovibrio diazotrophicus]